MLTKEELEQALLTLHCYAIYDAYEHERKELDADMCKLKQLINEHFELVEKATPKKAFAVKGWNDLYICPSCDENFFKGSMFLTTYCPYCGQSIDWSEEDE